MSEKETLSKMIAKYEKTLSENEVHKMEGEIKGIENAGSEAGSFATFRSFDFCKGERER
jgi:hypothetical protein